MTHKHRSITTSAGLKHAALFEFSLIAVVIIWGLNFPIVKSILGRAHPFSFNAVRFTVSVTFLWLVFLRDIRQTGAHVFRTYGYRLVLLGFVGHAIYQLLFISGLNWSTAGNTAFLISSAPIWTALTGHLFGLQRLTRVAWLGIALAVTGAAELALFASGFSFTRTMLVGNVFALLAALAWGSFTSLSAPILKNVRPGVLAAFTMTAALPVLWISAIPVWDFSLWVGDIHVWGVIAFSGVLSTGVAYVLWNVGIRHAGAAQTAVYANLVPVVALIVGYLWLREAIGVAQIVGAALILIGLGLARGLFPIRRPRKTSP